MLARGEVYPEVFEAGEPWATASSQQGQMLPMVIPQLPAARSEGVVVGAALGPLEHICNSLYLPARESCSLLPFR